MPRSSLRRLRVAAAASAASLLLGCPGGRSDTADTSGPSPAPRRPASNAAAEGGEPPFRLRDVTPASGVSAVYRNGREAGENSILESLGGGVAVVDYDADGTPDLFFPGGGNLAGKRVTGLPSSLWRGLGGLRFADASRPSGAADSRFYTHGVAAADYDNDGFADLLVTGYGGLQLFRNQGDGSFAEVAAPAGLTDDRWSSSAAWGDFDGDGVLDLYVAHYVNWSWDNHPRCPTADPAVVDVCGPRDFEPLDDVIYFADGEGAFRDGTAEAGLVSGGKGLGVIAADLDTDGRTDVYVANDTTENFLYLNAGEGALREAGLVSGTALDDRGIPNGSMGVAVLDFDRNLRPDLWVANYENETFALYRNDGGAAFQHVSDASGVTVLGGLFVGFGTVACDLELDGDEDLVVANGHVMYHARTRPGPQEAIVLRNDGRGRFARTTFAGESYFAAPHLGRGLAAGDLDGDGRPDLVFSNVNEPAAVLVNETPPRGRPLVTRLVGTRSNRDAIGARLVLETTSGRSLRLVCGGGSYLSTNEAAQFWAVPPGDDVRKLTIEWPSGVSQEVDAGRLKEGTKLVEPSEPRA